MRRQFWRRAQNIRAIFLSYQRDFAAHPPGGKKGAVLDGRDIGTVILPQADVKFYVTASLEARISRRHAQFAEKSLEEIGAEIRARDQRDVGSHRLAARQSGRCPLD